MNSTYHMLDYIHESPDSLHTTLQANETILLNIAQQAADQKVDKVVVSGLGSSYTAAMMAAPLFHRHCHFPCLIINAEETGYYAERWIDSHSLVVVISRSGERGAVIDTLNLAIQKGALGVAVTGVADSLLAQASGLTLLTREGPEITFPKTKSVMTCAGILMHLALVLADTEGKKAMDRIQILKSIPDVIKTNIRVIETELCRFLPEIKKYQWLDVVGTCSNYGVALEAAIKVQEASFIPTRADSTAGLLQGPVGALNKDWLVMALIMKEDLDLSKELLKLVKKFNAHSIGVYPQEIKVDGLCDYSIVLPQSSDPFLAALAYLPVVQLLAYYWTVERGMNPDEPSSMRSILDSILPPGREEPELKK